MAAQSLIFRFIGIDDGASAEFDRMAGKADLAAASLKKLGIGAAVVAAVIAVESIKAAAKFQSSTEMMVTQAGVAQKSLGGLRAGILGMAGDVGTGPEALSEALFHIVSTGQRGAAALSELKIAAEGAKVGGADLTDVTNALNATIVSGIKGAGNFSQAMGALNAIVGAGDMHMQDLANALGSGVLAVVKTFGVSLPQAGAALAVFGDNNIRGAQAATYLRQAVQSISDPSVKAAASLGKIHTTVTQLEDALAKGGLTGALTLLHTKFEDSGIAANKWGDILEGAFTKKAGTGITILLEQFGRYQLKQAEIKQGAQDFGADWTATTQTLSFQFNRLQADVQVLAIKLGDDLIPAALGVIHGFIEVGDAVSATVGFFNAHKTATVVLAGVLTGALLPALVATSAAMASEAWVSFAILMLRAKEAVIGFATGEDAAAVSTRGLLATIGPVAVAVGALAYEWEQARKAQGQGQTTAANFTKSLDVQTNSAASLRAAMAQTATQIQAVSQAFIKGGFHNESLDQEKAQVSALSKTYSTYQQEIVGVQKNTLLLGNAFGLTEGQVVALANQLGLSLNGNLTDLDTAFRNAEKSAENSGESFKKFAQQAQAAAGSTITATQAATAYANALHALTDPLFAENQALQALDAAHKQATADQKKYGDGSKEVKQDNLNLASSALTVETASRTLSAAVHDGTVKLSDARSQLRGWVHDGLLTKQQADQVIKSFGGLIGTAQKIAPTMTIAAAGVSHGATSIKLSAQNAANAAREALAGGEAGARTAGLSFADGFAAGIERGTVHAIAEAAAMGTLSFQAAKNAIQAKSPSKLTMKLGGDFVDGYTLGIKAKIPEAVLTGKHVSELLAEGLIDGWTGEASKLKSALETPVQDALNNLETKVKGLISKQQQALKTAQSTLRSELATKRSDISSLSGTISQGAGVSGIFGTDANGVATTANLGQFLGAQVGPLKTFARDLAMAHKKGLDNNLLNQIAQLGPQQGIQVLSQILSGQDSIRQLNAAQSAITRYSNDAATTVTDSLLKHTIQKDQASVEKNSNELHRLTEVLHRLETRAARNVASRLTVEINKSGTLKITRQEAREIARAINEYAQNVNPGILDGATGGHSGHGGRA